MGFRVSAADFEGFAALACRGRSPVRGTGLGPKTPETGRSGSRTLGPAGLLRSGPAATYRSGIPELMTISPFSRFGLS